MLGIAAAALAAALRGLNWAAFRVQLHQLDWRWLALAVVFDIASYAAQGVRWRCLLKQASLWQTTRAIYAGLFLNEIVPLRPGEAVRAWLAARDLRVGLLTVAPTMLAERLMDGMWLATALLVTLAMAPLPASLARAAWMVIAAMTVLLVTALLMGQDRYPFLARIRSGLSNRPALLASGSFLTAQGLAFWAMTRASHLSLGLAARRRMGTGPPSCDPRAAVPLRNRGFGSMVGPRMAVQRAPVWVRTPREPCQPGR